MYLRTESPWFATATVVRADNGRPMVVPGLTAEGRSTRLVRDGDH